MERLAELDPALFELLEREDERQSEVLAMVAASSVADSSVLACKATSTTNVTGEGYPGARFHAGCEVVDDIERLAIERAKVAFGAQYANVQPHSGTSANGVVIFGLLRPGDTLLGMDLDAGGHLTHGSKASVVGQYFQAVGYGVREDGLLDYDAVQSLARRHRPKLIICGTSAYPRAVDFARFRAIADDVGAVLMADVSHVSGLIAGGAHPSPVDHAHFTTTSTYKQLYGPRGGLILSGRDANRPLPGRDVTPAQLAQRGVFPFFQGTPDLSAIAAKARALAVVSSPEFSRLAGRIVETAAALADRLAGRGYRLVTGGTETHMVLVDVDSMGLTGLVAERALGRCNIVVNKNRLPGDRHSAFVTSGIRFGTNSLALRGLGADDMAECAELIDVVLRAVKPQGDRAFELADDVSEAVRARVAAVCRRFPVPDAPVATGRSAT
jgi:glycine hydroxymethyltransferase